MSMDSTNLAGVPKPASQGSTPLPRQTTNNAEPDKATQLFKKSVTPEEKEAERISEREFYINYIMETKHVSREVAEAQDDFFS